MSDKDIKEALDTLKGVELAGRTAGASWPDDGALVVRARLRSRADQALRGGRSSLSIKARPVSALIRLTRCKAAVGAALNAACALTMATLWQRSHRLHALWVPLFG
jgi:hypothetical protein